MVADRMTYIGYLRELIASAKDSENPADIAEFTRFDKDYLPILFDFYTTGGEEEGQGPVTLDVIKMYLTVARPELSQQLFEHAFSSFARITGPRKKKMVDLMCALIPYQSVENIRRLYLQWIEPLPEIKRGKEQKWAYRLLGEICRSHADGCREFLRNNAGSVETILRESLVGSKISSMEPRLRCVNHLLRSQPRLNHESEIIRSAITEGVICCKHAKQRCRVAAYELLKTVGEILRDHGEMRQFVTMVLGGFAGPPQLISATILALAFVLHDFPHALGNDDVRGILENVLNFMSVPIREIVDSCLSFVNVFLTSMPGSVVAASLPVIIQSFCGMSEECKRQFRLKIRYLLEIFVGKYGCDSIKPHIPTSDRVMYKCLHHLRKLHRSKKRKKSSEEEEITRRKSIEEILVISDSDVDEKRKKRKKSNNYNKFIQGNDSIVDFNDATINSRISDNDALSPVEYLPGGKRKRKSDYVVSGDSTASLKYKTGGSDIHRSLPSSNTEIPNSRKMGRRLRTLQVTKENLKINFARRVSFRVRSAYEDLLSLLIREEKLEFLQRNGINPANMSCILDRTGSKAVAAFNELFNLWFDEQGSKTKYLKTLEEQGIELAIMSRILSGAAARAAYAFKELYDLWFDDLGRKTKYLKTLDEQGVNLLDMTIMLKQAKYDGAKAFKNLYNLWFDSDGNKTRYLKTLENEGINLSKVSGILQCTGLKAPAAFKELYNLWFDAHGNKTKYLTTLEAEGISVTNLTSFLRGSKANAALTFKDLYHLWFDANGNKTKYLKDLAVVGMNLSKMSGILNGVGAKAVEAYKNLYDVWFDAKTGYLRTLEKNGIDLSRMTSILSTARSKAAKAFKELYNLWFDVNGNKTVYLRTLEKNGINLARISSILSAAGANAAEAFEKLYKIWFDAQGNKTQYLKSLEKEGINLSNVSSILHGAGANAPKAFKDLYNLWFDAHGNKTQYLKTLENEGVHLSAMTTILHGARANAAKSFIDLYNLWFDAHGNKTHYLKTLEKEGVNLSNMSTLLEGARGNAVQAFKNLYNLWFDASGNKTQYFKTQQQEKENKNDVSGV